MPIKFVVRAIAIALLSLSALILNAEGKFLPNETGPVMLGSVLFIVAGVIWNFYGIRRWHRDQMESGNSISPPNNKFFREGGLGTRYRRWLFMMPVFYAVGVLGSRDLPTGMRVSLSIFAVFAYAYVWYLYRAATKSK